MQIANIIPPFVAFFGTQDTTEHNNRPDVFPLTMSFLCKRSLSTHVRKDICRLLFSYQYDQQLIIIDGHSWLTENTSITYICNIY